LKLQGAFTAATNVYSLNCLKQYQFENFDDLKYSDYNPERLTNLNHPMYDGCCRVGCQL
jgi:hypothetical protein